MTTDTIPAVVDMSRFAPAFECAEGAHYIYGVPLGHTLNDLTRSDYWMIRGRHGAEPGDSIEARWVSDGHLLQIAKFVVTGRGFQPRGGHFLHVVLMAEHRFG